MLCEAPFFTVEKNQFNRKEMNMSPDEYGLLCDRILTETMQYITTDKMRRHIIDKSYIKSRDPIYVSAVTSCSPITIAYTPVGSGKSALIRDRVEGLIKSNIPASNIAVLSMNIAKVKQTELEMPGINCMTFSDFTHTIFMANRQGYELSDENSIVNTLRLCGQTPFRQTFLDRLSITNPQDKTSLLTVFVNNHLDEVEAELAAIHKIDYTLESMVCQNRMYQFDNNPFHLDEILINGVHNMPLHTLCCVLEYASMYGCNLYLTGMPDETIYEFNMAYGKAMNILSGYTNKLDISIVRLAPIRMNQDIQNTLMRKEGVPVRTSFVTTANVNLKYIADTGNMLTQLFAPGPGYIDNKLANHEQILVLARSKAEIAEIRPVITEYYGAKYPGLNIADLTAIQSPASLWGTVLTKYYASLMAAYPQGINRVELYRRLWIMLGHEIETASSKHMKQLYQKSQDDLTKIAGSVWTQDDWQNKPVITRIQEVIDTESRQIQAYNQYIRDNVTLDLSSANIIFSTIHSATDIRCDNTVVYLKNFSDSVDENLYRIALSRANESEYLIFVNSDNFDVPVQQYLKHHLTNASAT